MVATFAAPQSNDPAVPGSSTEAPMDGVSQSQSQTDSDPPISRASAASSSTEEVSPPAAPVISGPDDVLDISRDATPPLDFSRIPTPGLEDPVDGWGGLDDTMGLDLALLPMTDAQFNSSINGYPFTTTTDLDCGCAVPHVKIWARQETGGHQDHWEFGTGPGSDKWAAAQSCLMLISPANHWQGLPDPYMQNAARIDRMCITSAMHHNCLHIGVSDQRFCEDDSVSPFYRPSRINDEFIGSAVAGIIASSTETMVSTVQAIFKTMKPDLRPGRGQIVREHHPFYDVLPFPTLRRNALENLGTFDEDEFFHDTLSGLICWGNATVGKRDRDGVGSGTPWDSRSWEARGWFLRKYWSWLGGEDGELVRQSEWWRRMRGDESDPWEVIS